VLSAVTGKSVSAAGPVVVSQSTDHQWSAAELRETADRLGSVSNDGGARAVLRTLFVRGTFQGDQGVLGVSVRGDVLAVFEDSIAAASTPLVTRSSIEDAVVMHELGHLLGLVDLARNTGRADPDHPGHSKNSKSVMYWAVESSLVAQVLDGGPPVDYDDADLADLRALRGGA